MAACAHSSGWGICAVSGAMPSSILEQSYRKCGVAREVCCSPRVAMEQFLAVLAPLPLVVAEAYGTRARPSHGPRQCSLLGFRGGPKCQLGPLHAEVRPKACCLMRTLPVCGLTCQPLPKLPGSQQKGCAFWHCGLGSEQNPRRRPALAAAPRRRLPRLSATPI